jgi:hypothetical protein
MKFEDVDGDGKITQTIRFRIDKSLLPTFNYGATFEVRYKGFDLNICSRSIRCSVEDTNRVWR